MLIDGCRPPGRAVLARAITEISAPAVLIGLLLPVVGYRSGGPDGLMCGLIASVFAAVIPFGFVLSRVRAGRLTDHHVRERGQRRTPLLVGLVSVGAGFAVLGVLRAPAQLMAVLGAGMIGIAVTIAITRWWKISIHTGAASGCVTVLAFVFGPGALLLVALLPAIGWSRVVLKDHTVIQVVGGAVVGGLTAAVILPALANL